MSNWPDYDAVFALCMPLIKRFEGFSATPYQDVKGIATIGYGTIAYENGTAVTMADPPISEQAAETCLAVYMQSFANDIGREITRPASLHQAAAMLSLCYNIGPAAFAGSSVLDKFNAGDIPDAATAFLLWNKARINGVLTPVAGLTKRRQAEQAVFLTAD